MAATLIRSRPGTGPALLLIHGFPLDNRIWDDVFTRIPDRVGVYTPDLPGCGKTPLTEGPWTMDAYARWLLNMTTALGLKRFFVAGHSMGGYIVFAMHRLAPERIAGAAFVSSRALPDGEEARKAREAVAQRAEKEGPGFLAETMPGKAAGAAPPPEVIEKLRTIIQAAQPAGVAAMARGMAARPDCTPQLSKITFPTVVFAGRQDKIVPTAESEAMAKGIPGSKLVWCEQSGHVPMLEEPELVARELTALVS